MLPSELKVSREPDSAVEAGMIVKLDGSGLFTPTTAASDPFVGGIVEQPESGIYVVAKTLGLIPQVKAESGVAAGDELEPSGTLDGHVKTNSGGTFVGVAKDGASADGDGIGVYVRLDNFG